METNDLYVAVMYAKNKNFKKIIRMFLVSPIEEYNVFSNKPTIKGFKEVITNTVLIKGFNNKDINNRNIEWEILNGKATSLIPEKEILKYISIEKAKMNELLSESFEKANELLKNNQIKIKTK